MSFDALFEGRCDVIETNGTLDEGQQAGVVHRPALDVLQAGEKPEIHFRAPDKTIAVENLKKLDTGLLISNITSLRV